MSWKRTQIAQWTLPVPVSRPRYRHSHAHRSHLVILPHAYGTKWPTVSIVWWCAGKQQIVAVCIAVSQQSGGQHMQPAADYSSFSDCRRNEKRDDHFL